MSDPVGPEPFLPKISLRWLIGLVTLSAFAMGVVQQAITVGQMWAVLLTVVIACILLPVVLYVGTFTLASLFSTIGSAAAGMEAPPKLYSPTAMMPNVSMATAENPIGNPIGDTDSIGDTDNGANA